MQCLRTLMVDIARARTPELLQCRNYLLTLRQLLKAPLQARLHVFDRSAGPHNRPPSASELVPEGQLSWLFGQFTAMEAAGYRSVL